MNAITFREAMALRDRLQLQLSQLEILIPLLEEERVERAAIERSASFHVNLCRLNKVLPEACRIKPVLSGRNGRHASHFQIDPAGRAHLLSLIQDQARAA